MTIRAKGWLLAIIFSMSLWAVVLAIAFQASALVFEAGKDVSRAEELLS